MLVYPAIDLSEGQCVRLHRGEMQHKTVYGNDPAAMALKWVAAGGQFLHVVDLDGSFAGEPRNLPSVEAICQAAGIPVQVGGGIRTVKTIEQYFRVGVTRVILGTSAVRDREFTLAALERHGDRIVIDIGARDGRVAVQGWSEATDLDAVEFAQSLARVGACRFVFTDVSSDGAMAGPNLPAQQRMASALEIPVIASGGITTVEDVKAIAGLAGCGVEGMIIGRALYEGTIDLAEAIAAAR